MKLTEKPKHSVTNLSQCHFVYQNPTRPDRGSNESFRV